ncbi:MAG: tetratricopeptide repeat protein, partial [Promethearchaeota archaeon]
MAENISDSESKELTKAREFIIEGKFEESLQLLKDFELRKNNSFHDIVSCHLVYCDLLFHQGLFEKLIKLAEQTYKESLGLEKRILSIDALIYIVVGLVNSYDVEAANEIINQAERLLSTLKDESTINKTRREAKIVFLKGQISNPSISPKGDLEKALKYYKHSLAIGESLGDEFIVCGSLFTLGWSLFLYKGEIDNALECAEKALIVAKEVNYKFFISIGLLQKATYYHNKGEVTRSLSLYEQSLAIAKELNHKSLISSNLNNMADAYRMVGELDHALECSEQCLALIDILKRKAYYYDFLIQILIEKGDLERAQQNFNQLEQLNNQFKDKDINAEYLYNKALLLKESPRISDKGKAEEILKHILEDEDIPWEINERALLTLCELLIIEFQMTNETGVLDELESLITRLFESTEKSRSYWILCETYLLKAKIAQLSSDLKKARRLLAKGQQIAERFGLNRLAMSISEEHDKLLNELSLWEGLKESKASIGERIDLARLKDQVVKMLRKRIIDRPKTEAEQPILLSIMTREGDIVLSSPFTADMTIDESHFGEFLSSCNEFCDQIFSESFDRVKFGRYTILITAIESFCVYYMFQGHSYSAQQKLTHFCEAFGKDTNIMKILKKHVNESKVIIINEYPSIEELIVEIFISDLKKFQMPFKAYEGDKPFIFVSYSHTDKLQVYPIIDYLNKKGIHIWYDEGIPISENWKKSIVAN